MSDPLLNWVLAYSHSLSMVWAYF